MSSLFAVRCLLRAISSQGGVFPKTGEAVKPLHARQVDTAELQAVVRANAPPEWIEVARYLFAFLADVAAQKDANKMSAENVAMVWCPVLREQVDLSQFQVRLRARLPCAPRSSQCRQAFTTFTLRCVNEGGAIFALQP